jgi:hypothetical protein
MNDKIKILQIRLLLVFMLSLLFVVGLYNYMIQKQ